MSKDAYYFSHDSNARNDLKIVKLRMKSGLEGYGLYWCVIEMLRESDRYELPLIDIDTICYELRVDVEIFNLMFEFDLLSSNKKVFYSKSLKNRMLRLDEIKQKRKIAGAKGGKSKASAKQVLSNSKASKVKHSKEDNSKEEQSKKEDSKILCDTDIEIWPTFQDFWNGYNKKAGSKEKCKKKFDSLSQEIKEQIMNHIFEYVKATPDKTFRANPETYLNQKRWENEIIKNGRSEKTSDSKARNEFFTEHYPGYKNL